MCKTGKVRHSHVGATIALKKLKNAGLDPYRCRACGGWHLGNSGKPWKVQARIDQLLRQTPARKSLDPNVEN